MQRPAYWLTESGRTLVGLASDLPLQSEVSIEVHRDTTSETLLPLRDRLDEAILGLVRNVYQLSRVRGFKYYGTQKMCGVTIHRDHLSVFIRGLDIKEHPATDRNVISIGRPQHIHMQLKPADDFDEIIDLLREGLAIQKE